MDRGILAGPDRMELKDGRQLRLLSAFEILQARREAVWLAQEERERALCSNACLLARALLKDDAPVFQSGEQVLEQMTVEQIGSLSGLWADFNRKVNPGPDTGDDEVDALKKVWSTPGMSGCTGACCDPFQPCPRNVASDR